VFIAEQDKNPNHNLLTLYMVIRSPELGIVIRSAGRVEPDPVTGRLVTTFYEIPQQPFSHFRFKLRSGQRSVLATPATCGAYTVTADLYPWSQPQTAIRRESSFQITSGVDGGPCPSGGTPPFKPAVVSGTDSNTAGTYSSLYLRLERQDGEQEITGFGMTLPPGLIGNLVGIPFCTESQIQRAHQQSGAEAQRDPACPAASRIGATIAEAGVGGELAQTPGSLYLAGPYEGAPFSIVDVTAAKVGPFDLGTVVVHLPLQIDPKSAQVRIPSGAADQIPHIIDGIVIHLRTIRVYVDRERFTINPTSCEPLSLLATVVGSGADFASAADDEPAIVADRFQSADCASLQFHPSFAISTSGKTSRANGASLHVKLTYPSAPQGAQANVHSVRVELPKALPSRLSTLNHACPDSVFSQNPGSCPSQSRVGFAKATTPVLPVPLEGPAYFVSHGGEEFPDLIVVLQGYGVTVDLVGATFIKNGTTSSTFKTVPDVPVGTFELTLPEGRFSALAANTNLCTASGLVMPTMFDAQNGAKITQKTPIAVQGCPYTLTVLKHRVVKRALTLTVSVPAAGRLLVSGRGVADAYATAGRRQTLTLTLKERRAGRLRSKIRLRFVPYGKHRSLSRSFAVTFG
jgi:hypothetical protein